jgi:hypothetical protein
MASAIGTPLAPARRQCADKRIARAVGIHQYDRMSRILAIF